MSDRPQAAPGGERTEDSRTDAALHKRSRIALGQRIRADQHDLFDIGERLRAQLLFDHES